MKQMVPGFHSVDLFLIHFLDAMYKVRLKSMQRDSTNTGLE